MSEANAKGGSSGQTWKPSYNPWLIAVMVTLAAFMEILDTTIVNVALPYIAGSLATSNDNATYALTAYLVSNGIVLTVAGWISDTFGRKRYFLVCITMFTVCSFLCGIAQSLGQLVVFRALQGFFGGGLQPNQQAIILDTFPPARRSAAFAITAIATVVAPVLGPTLGGYLVEHENWRWIFFVNIPVGAVAVFGNSILIEDPPWEKSKRGRSKRGFDYVGLSFIVLGFACMQFMVDRGEDDDWFGSGFIQLMALGAFVGLVGGLLWLLAANKPIIDLEVFKDRNFAMGCVLIGAMGMILYASSVLIPQLAQQQLGYTALLSGLVLSPGGIAVILLIPIVGKLQKVLATRYVVMIGFTVMGASLMYSSNLISAIDFRTLVYMRTAQTAALGFLFVPISNIAYLTLPQRYRSNGAALFSMFRNVGGAIGISLAQALVTERTQADQAHLSVFMTTLNQGYNVLVQQSEQALLTLGRAPASVHDQAVSHTYQTYMGQAAILAYNNVFQYSALLAFLVVPLCLIISNKTPAGEGGGT